MKSSFYLWFILGYLIFEITLKLIFPLFGLKGFSSAPYLRIGLLFFTLLFFSFDLLRITIPKKIKSTFLSIDTFVFGWLFFCIISLLVGILNKNPLIYIITDFTYVLFGALLFYLTGRRNSNIKAPESFSFFEFSKMFFGMSLICFFFNLKAPALLLILMVISIYINILKKRNVYAFLNIVLYFVLVLNSNRTQLIVFFLMLFIIFLKKIRIYYSLKSVIFIGLILCSLIFLLKQQILESLLLLFDSKSTMGYRINQIAIIFRDGIDYSNPFFTSIAQRILEVQAVIEYWTTDLFSFIFGSGSGGVVNGSAVYSDTSVLGAALLGAEKVHNIHILPFALIFRYGIVGLMLFCFLLIKVCKSIINILNEEKDVQMIFWNLFFIFWFVFSIPASSFLWTMPLFWISLAFIKKNRI